MKGVVFTEFLDMVEERFSPALADELLESCELPSGGVYTAVGTYSADEMTLLVEALSVRVGLPVAELLEAYGVYLFERFFALYPGFFDGPTDALSFVSTVDSVVHAEVDKLYSDAELPSFDIVRPGQDTLVMTYQSPRHLGDLAAGLLRGAVEHYGEPVGIMREPLAADGSVVRFTLTRARV
jgi:hypothetical protein